MNIRLILFTPIISIPYFKLSYPDTFFTLLKNIRILFVCPIRFNLSGTLILHHSSTLRAFLLITVLWILNRYFLLARCTVSGLGSLRIILVHKQVFIISPSASPFLKVLWQFRYTLHGFIPRICLSFISLFPVIPSDALLEVNDCFYCGFRINILPAA